MSEAAFFAAISPRGCGWTVRRAGRSRALMLWLTRDEAWREARRLARGAGVEAYLVETNGRIIARNNYRRPAA